MKNFIEVIGSLGELIPRPSDTGFRTFASTLSERLCDISSGEDSTISTLRERSDVLTFRCPKFVIVQYGNFMLESLSS